MADSPIIDELDVEEIGARVDALLDRIAATDPTAAALANELVAALLALHGAGLERLVDVLRAKAPIALDELADDVLVSGLLLLHDLQPAEVASPLRLAVEAHPPAPEAPAEAFIPLEAVVRRPPHPGTVPFTRTNEHASARVKRTAGEGCHICSAPMGDEHRHVVDLDQRSILCTCRACGLLFEGGAARSEPSTSTKGTHEHFRTVPDRFVRIEPFEVSATQWAALQIPVGISFVIVDSCLDQPVAFYPSPGGATQSELSLDAWDDLVATNPAIAEVEPDVEAVLVRNERDQIPQCHIVPVDRCYELVGRLRMHWRGFDGGQEVRAAIEDFFADVGSRARPVSGATR